MPRGRGNRGHKNNDAPRGGHRGRGVGRGDRGLPNRGERGGRGHPQSSPHPSRAGPWLPQGMQTSHSLDLFHTLSLNEGDESVVFEGGFEDFSLGNPIGKSALPQQPYSRSVPISAPVPAPAPVVALALAPPPPPPAHRGGRFRGRGGPWRGHASLLPPLPLAFSHTSLKRPFNSRGRGIDTHPINNSNLLSKFPRRPTNVSKGPRISLEALERDRPLLKPVRFIRGEQQTLLFEEQEEILHVPGEDKEHADQVLPSADTIERIFHPQILDNEDAEAEKSDSDSENEESPDIDDTQIVKSAVTSDSVVATAIQVQTEHIPVPKVVSEADEPVVQRSELTGLITEPVLKDEVEMDIIRDSLLCTSEHQTVSLLPIPHSSEPPLFVISTDPDVTGASDTNANDDVQYNSIQSRSILGITSDDEVVYEAPNSHLRPSKVPPVSESPSNPDVNTLLPSLPLEQTPTSHIIQRTVKAQALSGLKVTPRMRRMFMYEKGIRGKGVHKKKRGKLSLLALGLQREESILELEADETGRMRGMKAQRRHGSDIDWGSVDDSSDEGEDKEENARESLKSGNEAAEEDPVDSDIDIKDLVRFVQGAEALSKGNGAGETIDDLKDVMKLKEEDEMIERRGSSEDENGEGTEDGLSSESSFLSEEVSFQTKLKNMRGIRKKANEEKRKKGKQKAVEVFSSDSSEDDDEDEDDDLQAIIDKADDDEQFLSEIQDILDADRIWLHGHGDRSGKKSKRDKNKGKGKEQEKFNAIHDGSFEYKEWDISYNTSKKDKVKSLPPSLKERWNQDRLKKAERKQERQLQRELEEIELAQAKLALNISPSGKSKLSKLEKGLLRRTGKGSATPMSDDASERLDIQYISSTTIRIKKIAHLETLERFIRTTFLPNLEIDTVILPPKEKAWRKEAHDIAMAFNLKKQSAGKEGERFLTLIRTSRSGIATKEGKIRRILRNERGAQGWRKDKPVFREGRAKIRTRDGDEVGAAAPKIDSSNIGFKILEKMGWSEGQRIGVIGGLADPLTAIIKTSKLGLGATR